MSMGAGVAAVILTSSPTFAVSVPVFEAPVVAETRADSRLPLTAPASTEEVWLDVEGAGAAVTGAQVRTGTAAWKDAAASSTPFGTTALAAAGAGPVDARWKVSGTVRADFSVTFVDGHGTILSEQLLRNVAVSGDSNWVDWATLKDGVDPSEPENPHGPPGAAAAANGESADATGGESGDAGSRPAGLSQTGSDSAWLWIGGGVLLAAGATAAAAAHARYRRTRDANLEGGAR